MKLAFPLDTLALDRQLTIPLQRQLYGRLRTMIEERTLGAGTSLPSSRSLARDLGIARNTVVNVYEQLTTEGFLSGRRGARPEVVFLPTPSRPIVETVLPRKISARGEAMFAQPFHQGTPGFSTFHPGMPDAEHFPFNTWSRLLAHRAKVSRYDLFGGYSIAGYPALQEAIAGYVKVARGVRCSPDQVVVTTGAQAALDLLARLLLDPGDVAWVEEPGYYGAHAAFVGAGAQLKPLYVGQDGWTLELPKGHMPRVIYLTPACQHPLGHTMTDDQRSKLLEIAGELDAMIIEDDFDGEYRFPGRPVPAIQGSDRAGRVIYVGTFAKLLFPALRLGFMILPESLMKGIAGPLVSTGQYAPLLLQAALSDFINQGYMSTHLRRMRILYQTRRRVFRELSEEYLGSWLRLLPGEAGIQIVGEFRDPEVDDREVAAAARRRGINVSPLSIQYRHGAARAGLVMGCAAVSESAMPSGFRLLAEAFLEVLG